MMLITIKDVAINPDHIVLVEPNWPNAGTAILLSVPMGAGEGYRLIVDDWDVEKTKAEIKYAILREAGTWGRQNY